MWYIRYFLHLLQKILFSQLWTMWTTHLGSKLERISLPAPVKEKFKKETSWSHNFLSKVPFCLWVSTLEGVRGDTTPSTLNPLPSTLNRRPPATSKINRVVGVTVPLTDRVTFSSMRGSRGVLGAPMGAGAARKRPRVTAPSLDQYPSFSPRSSDEHVAFLSRSVNLCFYFGTDAPWTLARLLGLLRSRTGEFLSLVALRD